MDALEAVRPLLPVWTGLAPLALWAPAACVIGWTTAAIARRVAIGPYRRLAPGSSWVERARHAWPARTTTGLAILLALAALGAIAYWRGGAPFSLLPPIALAGVVAACACAGGLRVSASLARELFGRPISLREIARDAAVRLLLAALPIFLALALAPALRAPLDWRDFLLLASLALLFAATACGGGLRLLGWLRQTQPVPERLRRACLAAAAGGREPKLWVVRWGPATAFAFPLSNEIAFSSRCVEALDDDELRAVAAHEIAHLREPLAVRLLRGAVLMALLPLAALPLLIDLAGPFAALGLLLAIVVLMWGFQKLALRMEQRADRHALGGAESSPLYARALERLYELNLIPAVMSGRQVHPHLYDRLLAAGVTPAYPRPEPPSGRRGEAAIAVAALWLAVSATVLAGAPLFLQPAAVYGERASDLWIALEPGAQAIHSRALLEHSLGHGERTLAFARAAAALEPSWHEPTSLVAMELARQGRCREATQALAESMSRCTCGEDAWVETARSWVVYCESRANETTSAAAPL
jgi:Zn-dependent protease with chaperone function